MRAAIGQLYPAVAQAGGYLENLQRARHLLPYFQSATAAKNEAGAHQAEVAIRSWIRIAWEEYADLHASGFEIPQRHFEDLISVEHEIGAGALPDDRVEPVPLFAKWTLLRLDKMSQLGASDRFAAKVLWLRAESWSKADSLMAAAMGAPIWWQEGLERETGLELRGLNRIAEIVGFGSTTKYSEIIPVLGRAELRRHPEQRQAIALGVVKHAWVTKETVLFEWVSALWQNPCFGDELAIPVAQNMAAANNKELSAAVEPLTQALHNAVEQQLAASWTTDWKPGQIRTDAINNAKQILQHTERVKAANLVIEGLQGSAHAGLTPDAVARRVSDALAASLGRATPAADEAGT
jgi:hypothetical protein